MSSMATICNVCTTTDWRCNSCDRLTDINLNDTNWTEKDFDWLLNDMTNHTGQEEHDQHDESGSSTTSGAQSPRSCRSKTFQSEGADTKRKFGGETGADSQLARKRRKGSGGPPSTASLEEASTDTEDSDTIVVVIPGAKTNRNHTAPPDAEDLVNDRRSEAPPVLHGGVSRGTSDSSAVVNLAVSDTALLRQQDDLHLPSTPTLTELITPTYEEAVNPFMYASTTAQTDKIIEIMTPEQLRLGTTCKRGFDFVVVPVIESNIFAIVVATRDQERLNVLCVDQKSSLCVNTVVEDLTRFLCSTPPRPLQRVRKSLVTSTDNTLLQNLADGVPPGPVNHIIAPLVHYLRLIIGLDVRPAIDFALWEDILGQSLLGHSDAVIRVGENLRDISDLGPTDGDFMTMLQNIAKDQSISASRGSHIKEATTILERLQTAPGLTRRTEGLEQWIIAHQALQDSKAALSKVPPSEHKDKCVEDLEAAHGHVSAELRELQDDAEALERARSRLQREGGTVKQIREDYERWRRMSAEGFKRVKRFMAQLQGEDEELISGQR